VRGKQNYITSGCIRTGKQTCPLRLQHIFEGLTKIIQDFSPTIAVVEKIFVHINVSSALKLGQARGVAIVAATLNGLDIAEYTARQVKKTVVGNGAADKVQVQHMMKVLLKLSGLPQADAADALAVAVCHAQNTRGIL
jgi:crossover junction endodeoxyribonuclease RuvC